MIAFNCFIKAFRLISSERHTFCSKIFWSLYTENSPALARNSRKLVGHSHSNNEIMLNMPLVRSEITSVDSQGKNNLSLVECVSFCLKRIKLSAQKNYFFLESCSLYLRLLVHNNVFISKELVSFVTEVEPVIIFGSKTLSAKQPTFNFISLYRVSIKEWIRSNQNIKLIYLLVYTFSLG